MRKLIYIFLLLPIFVNGQILENPSYPFQGYAFQGDGVANYIDKVDEIFTSWTLFFKIPEKPVYGSNWICYFKNTPIINLDNIDYENIHLHHFGFTLVAGKEYDIIVKSKGTDSLSLFVNGSFITTIDVSFDGGTNYLNTSYLFTYSSGYYRYNGKVTHIGVYDTELSDSTILKYYSDGILPDNPDFFYIFSAGNGSTVYDVSGNGKNGTLYGSNYWTESDNTYNDNYGVTKLKYNGDVIFVPYNIDKTPIYNHSNPIMDASELYINYPASKWGKTYWVK